MSSQEENNNKLSDEEKFRLIEFCKDNNELWVTNQGKTRSQRTLKKEELIEDFEKKFSIKIFEKPFHGLKASFLREHKKMENCPRNHGSDMKACFS